MGEQANSVPARLAAGLEIQTGLDGAVALRPLGAADAQAFAAHVAGDLERLRRLLPWPDPTSTQAGARAWLESYEQQRDGRVLVVGAWLDERLLGGALLFHHEPDAAIVELGCWVVAEAEGKGVAGACCRLLIEHARRGLHAERLEWRAVSVNESSLRLAARLAFRREGTLRSGFVLRGERYDVELLSLVGAELDQAIAAGA